ncbi:unnamed protein product [Rotaria magnacalcarata]|uniref:Glycerophosphocholine acyltransferase 1 n=1 Tax=Rotaria magnacalcarata TaxID=392030 RepID=A0A816ASX1_9BILA|nr:unnamed protein product [Rotaria magnacalcarata]CAF1598838.1 unnamed protein product [Rotaria magnacalcarata]CAF2096966.1 unnamed protein product [Rotaria magnacalcarata]CAF2100562.1 unnamed protein product [Rotaria magnacalcarata]
MSTDNTCKGSNSENDSKNASLDYGNDELLNEELDFFDFLEMVTNQIDTIASDIKFQENQEKSPHRWQRTTADLAHRRRRLKSQLEQRVHIWSKNLKQPNFIRTRDKISFSIGVVNACCSPLIVSRWPHLLPLVYTVQALFLIPLRFLSYKRKSWHYSVYDLCYFVNLLTLLYLWVFPSSIILFTVCYMLSHGPLIFAIVLWRNSLVFHSLDNVTSVFIHMYPALTLFTIRWLLPINLQREWYPAIAAIGLSIPTVTAIFYTVVFYLLWQLLYYVFIIYGRREKVARGLRATSYTWLLADKTSFVSRLIGKFIKGGQEEGIDKLKVLVYFILQFCYMLASILPVCWWYYSNMNANVIFLCSIFAVSVYNGASFYIDVFSRCYIKSFELLHDCGDLDDNKNATCPIPETSQAQKNTS